MASSAGAPGQRHEGGAAASDRPRASIRVCAFHARGVAEACACRRRLGPRRVAPLSSGAGRPPVAAEPVRRRPPAPRPRPFRCAPRFARVTLGQASRGALARGHAVVITDDGRGVAARVAARLRGAGQQVALVRSSGTSDPGPALRVARSIRWRTPKRLAGAIIDACGPVAAADSPGAARAPASVRDSGLRRVVDQLVARDARRSSCSRAGLRRAAAAGGPEGGAALLAATVDGRRLRRGVRRPLRSGPSHGGVAGFIKCRRHRVARGPRPAPSTSTTPTTPTASPRISRRVVGCSKRARRSAIATAGGCALEVEPVPARPGRPGSTCRATA